MSVFLVRLPFNQTNVELKQQIHQKLEELLGLLIRPMWN